MQVTAWTPVLYPYRKNFGGEGTLTSIKDSRSRRKKQELGSGVSRPGETRTERRDIGPV